MIPCVSPGDAGTAFQARLDPRQPQAWLVAYAATLHRHQRTPTENLGRSFSEQVLVRCLL